MWANGMEGGHVHGREHVRAYWRAQWEEIDPTVDPLAVTEGDDGRTLVVVHQVVRALDGELLADVELVHAFTTDGDGQITRFDIEGPGPA
jgi:hypothetical protein